MTAREFLSPDLLNGLEGIEQGLRRRRNLGRAGGIGLVVFTIFQLALVIMSMVTTVPWDALVSQWFFVLPSLLVATALGLFVAARYWIRESRSPFRYTCRIVDFDPVAPTPAGVLPWLRHDLAELLNDRIGRLSFLDKEPEDPEQREAHVHIAGEYLVREEDNGRRVIEVTPRVRVGGPNASESLAHAVRYELPGVLKRDDYDKILERVYFSVATRLYKQIQDDVERKIALLPTRYLRATAYVYEAEDYAQSNTLDAYDDAQKLFEKARLLYDPSARPLPTARLRRLSARAGAPARRVLGVLRRAFSHAILRFAKREAMLARTELGLANTLVARRALARLSGRRVNQIFAARAIAEHARDRLVRLAAIGYRDADESLFDARVTLALVFHYLGSDARAEGELELARSSLPDRAEQNASYLFAAALLEPRTTFALSLLRRAVELNPRFEVAQFERAQRTETLWQFRPGLERTVAETVIAEYMNVVRINPGNILAWSSLGHTHWLLATDEKGLEEAEKDFLRGLEYKQIKGEAFMARLHHSLARVAAERGRFTEAYGYYVASTTASVGEGNEFGTWAEQHNTVVRNEAMIRRFERYVANVGRKQLENVRGPDPLEPRILRSVAAFVKNDYGEACLNFFERSGKQRYRTTARREYRKALKRNPSYVIPAYNLCLLSCKNDEEEAAGRYIEAVRSKEPKWPEAILEQMMVETFNSREPMERRAELEDDIRAMQEKLQELQRRQKAREKSKMKGEFGEAVRTRPSPSATGLGADATEIVAAGLASYDLAPVIDQLEHRLESLEEERQAVQRKLEASARRVREDARGLVPHEWLWRASGQEGWEFRWKALQRPPRFRQRWEQDFGDLHVRALATWARTRALSRVDETEGSRLTRRRQKTRDLLCHLETHFWPDHYELLCARRQLEDEPLLAERIGSLAARSLAFDPAHYRLLVKVDKDLDSETQAERKREVFAEALAQRDVEPPVLAWLGQKLEDLHAYEDALKAYRGAIKVQHADVAEADVRLGKARAEWGLRRYAAALASLRSVPKHDVPENWRTAFVSKLDEREQNWDAGRAGKGAESLAPPPPVGRGFSSLRGISRVGKVRGERAADADAARGEPTPADSDDQVGYRMLVSWLEQDHRACIRRNDVVAAADAAQALVRLAEARYAKTVTAPNRTAPLPDVSAETDDSGAGGAPVVVPFIRRLAVEAHPEVFASRGADRLWTLVRSDIPELQETIENETGVPVPTPAFAANHFLAEDGYRVLVNEIPVAERRVGDGEGYGPILAAVRDVMHENLEALVGLDDIVHALRAMRDDDAGLIDKVLADDAAKLQLLKTVRRMIRSGLRVDSAELLRELAPDDAEPDVDGIVDAMRVRRRVQTNGDRPERSDDAGLRGPSWAVRRT